MEIDLANLPEDAQALKALVLWSRSLELFDDAGYAQDFIPAGMIAHGAQISTGKEIMARVSLDSLDSRFPYALMIAQNKAALLGGFRLLDLALPDGSTVLDLASGTGEVAAQLARALPHAAVTALDASPRMIDAARARVER